MKISPEVSARIANASLVAALLVVVIHLPGEAAAGVRLLLRDFGRCAVPFFFCVSGYLLAGHANEVGWWRRETVKRIRTVLIPYLAWSVLFALVMLAGAAWQHEGAFSFGDWVGEKGFLLLGLDLTDLPFLVPLWYLRTLMFLVWGSVILVPAVRTRPRLTLSILGLIYLAFSALIEWQPALAISVPGALLRQTFVPEAFFYFALGLAARLQGVAPPVGRTTTLLSLTTALALLLAHRLLAEWGLAWTLPYAWFIPFALLFLWSAVPKRPWPKTLTAMAFPVYVMHFFVTKLCPEDASGWIAWLVFVTAIVAPCLCTLLLRRFVPKLAEILFGGR